MEILKLVLPCERKSSALEKKWNMKKCYFPKMERPGFGGGGRFASFHKNDVIFGNVVYYSEKKMFFKISHLPKKRQKVP